MKLLSLCLACSVVLTSPSVPALRAADAPSEDPGRRMPPPQERRGNPDRFGPPGRMMMMGPERILNEEQREQFRAALQPHRSKLRDLEEKIPALRRQIEESLLADPLDEAILREKARALAEAEADRALIRARAFAKIRASLSLEQVEDLKDWFAEMGRVRRPDGPPMRGGRDGFRPGGPESQGGFNREGGDLPPPRPPREP